MTIPSKVTFDNPMSTVKTPLRGSALKVTLIGVFDNIRSSCVHISDGFKKHEHPWIVNEYDYRKAQNQNPKKLHSDLVRLSQMNDLMIILKGSKIPPLAIKEASKNCSVMIWWPDAKYIYNKHKEVQDFSRYAHYRLATGYDMARHWAFDTKLPCYHVLDGSNPDLWYPEQVEKDIDISFIGADVEDRGQIYADLKRKTNFNVQFYGPGFNQFAEPDQFRNICSRSMIVLNMSRWPLEGYSSLRLWTSLACGSMVMTKRIPGMEKHLGLHDDVHVVSFRDTKELIEKATYYLRHAGSREMIAENGYNFLLKYRQWKHTVDDIYRIVTQEQGVNIGG